NARFGYNACVEISQPDLFSQVVTSAVIQHFKGRNEFARAEHSKCAYQHTRIISGRLHGFSEALIQLGELSVDTIDVLSDKKYLIKEDTYRKDSEYRFAFESRGIENHWQPRDERKRDDARAVGVKEYIDHDVKCVGSVSDCLESRCNILRAADFMRSDFEAER